MAEDKLIKNIALLNEKIETSRTELKQINDKILDLAHELYKHSPNPSMAVTNLPAGVQLRIENAKQDLVTEAKNIKSKTKKECEKLVNLILTDIENEFAK